MASHPRNPAMIVGHYLLASMLLLILAGASYAAVLRLTGNFHVAVPGELYRSAQLTSSQLATYARVYDIKTIVNLRGESTGRNWYEKEVAESTRLGITHIDFRMSSRQTLSRDDAAALLALLKQAPRPILIHCEGGADRSGLVAALYVAAVAHGGEDAAEAQMSIRYGHLSVAANPAFAMDRSFEALEPWLGFPNS